MQKTKLDREWAIEFLVNNLRYMNRSNEVKGLDELIKIGGLSA